MFGGSTVGICGTLDALVVHTFLSDGAGGITARGFGDTFPGGIAHLCAGTIGVGRTLDTLAVDALFSGGASGITIRFEGTNTVVTSLVDAAIGVGFALDAFVGDAFFCGFASRRTRAGIFFDTFFAIALGGTNISIAFGFGTISIGLTFICASTTCPH